MREVLSSPPVGHRRTILSLDLPFTPLTQGSSLNLLIRTFLNFLIETAPIPEQTEQTVVL
jgi:hypothetical protein